MIDDAVLCAEDGTDDGLGHLGLDALHVARIEELCRDAVRLLKLDPARRGVEVGLTFDELEMADAPVADRSVEHIRQPRPRLLGARYERQFPRVAAVGADAPLAFAPGRPARDRSRLDDDHVVVVGAPGARPWRTRRLHRRR